MDALGPALAPPAHGFESSKMPGFQDSLNYVPSPISVEELRRAAGDTLVVETHSTPVTGHSIVPTQDVVNPGRPQDKSSAQYREHVYQRERPLPPLLTDERADVDGSDHELEPHNVFVSREADEALLRMHASAQKKPLKCSPLSAPDRTAERDRTSSLPPYSALSDASWARSHTSRETQRARNLLQNLVRHRGTGCESHSVNAAPASVVDEMQTGLLPVAMLKFHMERDEHDSPRMPVLLQYLRLRITDTIFSQATGHRLYRIELEYGGGLMRWVIYRDFRDFLALHAYIRTQMVTGSLAVRRRDGSLVDAPSLPSRMFSAFLPRQRAFGPEAAGAERTQRDELTSYLVKVIECVMFRPQSNRVCRFFELSALALQMAGMPGLLGKQGEVLVSRTGRHTLLRQKRRKPMWIMVRESYIVVCKDIQSLQVYDVFLMDQEFEVQQHRHLHRNVVEYAPPRDEENVIVPPSSTVHSYLKRHSFVVHNAERRLKLHARSERLMEQFLLSLRWAAAHNPYGQPNRFGSFAPIRRRVSAQWLVDGRDYFWNVATALDNARERIYIHDWWLSPELYLRRPGQPEWRLDYILQRKAAAGVRVFVILYNEVSNQFTPTDSGYAKARLTGLHPNIYVQRSPSHLKTGTFYWAHHEKMCVVDEMVGFMGGFDLCFGRWDTPSHTLTDDATGAAAPGFLGPVRDGAEAHVWPGQDYANERVAEWTNLTRPEADLLPRDRTPRMPWHDVGVQILGAPARDLCRHFVQRWNMLLRIRHHSRRMPFLLPPPDLPPAELARLGVLGTCEVQICRSAGPWSLNTPKRVEHSVQNAYLKVIERSERFVYIENQFFCTSTVLENVEVENSIGLALVERIIRAHREGTPWRSIIVIPLIPGFPAAIDGAESGGVRIIMSFQALSIARGPNSVFGRLERAQINPHDYIGFYALRNWGTLESNRLVTEQVYLHDKIMIADDRVAIIGSANINDRSQRGDRDSELACVIRDEDHLASRMGGKPFEVGRFPHTLRLRLMREHLGVDVDGMELEALGQTLPRQEPPPLAAEPTIGPWAMPMGRPNVTSDALVDPLEAYVLWKSAADYNTNVYRRVFQCIPDDQIMTWPTYKTAMAHAERLASGVVSPEELEPMTALLRTCCGPLVHYAVNFLEREANASNFMFPMDYINPLAVFD